MAQSSFILRVELNHKHVTFGDLASIISKAGGDISSIDVISSGKEFSVRDITVDMSENTESTVVEAIKQHKGIKLVNVSDRTFLVHLGGKIHIQPNLPIKNRDDLSKVYTPGVSRICTSIHENPEKAYSLTIKRNTVAVVSDGTAVLGLGDIGPFAAIS